MDRAIPTVAPPELLPKLQEAVLAISATGSLEATLLSLIASARKLVAAQHATVVLCPPSTELHSIAVVDVSSKYEPYRVYFDGLDLAILLQAADAERYSARLFAVDQLPEATSLQANRRGLLAPPLRSGVMISLESRRECRLGVIYLTGEVSGGFSSEDCRLLTQFATISSSLLELYHTEGASDGSGDPGSGTLAKANRALLRSSEKLEDFSIVSTYELQKSLQAVVGYCQLVQAAFGAKCSADNREHAQVVVDGANGLKQMVNNLMQAECRRQESDTVATADCNRVVAEALRNLTKMLENAPAKIHCDPLPVVRGDLGQLVQLFENLIQNAIQYRGERLLTISISVHERDKEWAFSIGDNGLGISAELRDRIFQVFPSRHENVQRGGTGIGLAVCKRIIDRHGGRISIVPNSGGGSICRFTLPKKL